MIKWLNEIDLEEVSSFGGKATNLGFLSKKGFNVPKGFCISADIVGLTKEIRDEIADRYKRLDSNVAVRSSATVEDSKTSSFAGQFESFLNIDTEEDLYDTIGKCWESAKSKHLRAYMRERHEKGGGMAVIVQGMIDAEFAGVVFTIEPVKKKHMIIEIVKGYGDKLMSGEVTPSSYTIKKKDLSIIEEIEPILPEDILKRLSKTAVEIEKTYESPQDIEFAINEGKIYILQSRPITTL